MSDEWGDPLVYYPEDYESGPRVSVVITSAAAYKHKKQRFLDDDQMLPLGTLSLFGGRGGTGKTLAALSYAAKLTTGTLPGEFFGQPKSVLMISHEDDPRTQTNPRFEAAGGDKARLFHTTLRLDHKERSLTLSLENHLERLELIAAHIREQDVKLVIFDPFVSLIDVKSIYDAQQVRHVLDPLLRWSQELEIVTLGLMHLSKGDGAAADRLSASHAFRDASRSLVMFDHDDETDERVMIQNKSSYSADKGSFNYTIETTPVMIEDEAVAVPYFVKGLPSNRSERDVWNKHKKQNPFDEAVFKCVRDNGPVFLEYLKNEFPNNSSSISWTLKRLIENGRIVKTNLQYSIPE